MNGGDGSVPNPIPNAFIGVADFVFHDMNWTDVLWGNANSTQHNLSLSGGTDKSSYRLSLGYLNDQGTLQWVIIQMNVIMCVYLIVLKFLIVLAWILIWPLASASGSSHTDWCGSWCFDSSTRFASINYRW